MRRVLAALGLFLVGSFCALGCTSSSGCSAGDRCECSQGDQCYLDCDGDGCNQSCHNMNRCGTVCGDNCISQVHDVMQGSQSCGSGCGLTCWNTNSCGLLCGDNCHFDCHDTPQCSAVVGPNSDVTCRSVGACQVECTGSCTVHCQDQNCQISCAGGTDAMLCEPGRYACGGC